ncbi:MAG: GIY-YIG nuclease family protein [Patescibacteria group bacterium]|nr:GIY-YIG nuclease family protein [Patescibacteria group bacterium]
MYYTYILQSKKTKELYIGYTERLVERLKEHNAGLSYATKKYAPWELVYFEGYANEVDSQEREKKLKQFGRVYSQLKRRIARSLHGTEKVRG